MEPYNLDAAQAVVERGEKARALLENEAFLWIVDQQTNFHLAALVAAPPGPSGADAVAYHHNQQYALTELVATLGGYVQAGEEQLSMLNEQDLEGYQDDRS